MKAAKLEIGVGSQEPRARSQEERARRKEPEARSQKQGARRSVFTNRRCSRLAPPRIPLNKGDFKR